MSQHDCDKIYGLKPQNVRRVAAICRQNGSGPASASVKGLPDDAQLADALRRVRLGQLLEREFSDPGAAPGATAGLTLDLHFVIRLCDPDCRVAGDLPDSRLVAQIHVL